MRLAPDGIHAIDFEDDDRIGTVCWCGGCAEDPCTIRDHEAKAYTYGLAAAFGIIGMAEAISRNHALHCCKVCGKASGARVLASLEDGYTCMRCFLASEMERNDRPAAPSRGTSR